MTYPMFVIFVVKSAVSHTEPGRKVKGQKKKGLCMVWVMHGYEWCP